MEMDSIVTMIMNCGSSIVIIAYLIFKDIRFQNELQKILTNLDSSLKSLEKALDKIESKRKDD